MAHVIFHVDMNSFFASCEIAEDESLKGKKVVVAHNSPDKRGIVLAASYEAKREGVYTTQPLYDVLRKVNDVIIKEPRHDLYQAYSDQFFDYFYKITPLVEPGSIDEAYLDVTGVCANDEYLNLAKKIQDDILNLYHLPCSIGIGPNKFLAKMGSDMKKPLGITVIRKRDVEKMLYPLPLSDMFGAGKKTCEVLSNIGIKTIGDLANYKNPKLIVDLVGPAQANYLIAASHGEGSAIVDPDRYQEASSISRAHTFDHNVYNIEEMKMMIKMLSNDIQAKMEKAEYLASTFSISLKFDNYKAVSKSYTIKDPTNDSLIMYNIYLNLFEELRDEHLAVRLVSVGATKFTKTDAARQLSIFDSLDEIEKENEVRKTIKNINEFLDANLHFGIKQKKE